MTTPSRRVIALAPMPPEKSAYALARYSRSPDSIEESLKWVHGHSSEKFWEQFYFDYGHGSLRISATSLSVLNRFRVQPRFGWKTNKSGTARPSRVGIKTSPPSWYVPDNIPRARDGLSILRGLSTVYRALHDR